MAPLMARFSTNPGSGISGSTVNSNFTCVLSPWGVNVYLPSWRRC
ncbi:Uncharacterised protein [Mycobacteroides abscessus subsp. abscessus]|nr:Uncharacterised protein [Mycobacteroides abscessus subsp. abscessus]